VSCVLPRLIRSCCTAVPIDHSSHHRFISFVERRSRQNEQFTIGEEGKGKVKGKDQGKDKDQEKDKDKDASPAGAEVVDLTPGDSNDGGNADAGGSASSSSSAIDVDADVRVGSGSGDRERRHRQADDSDISGGSANACAAAGCERPSQIDSKFCCHECGVRDSQVILARALLHSLEMGVALDRGRRLRETRELKAKKQQARARERRDR